MTGDRRDKLLHQDWSDAWEGLPEAPPLVPRPKSAQITLRLPASLLSRVKRVAVERSLPYHALVRSWLIDGLREDATPESSGVDEPQTKQLNVKLSQEVLDELKAHGHDLGRPYHRLARELVEAAVAQEETSLGLDRAAAEQPQTRDLMVLLLHATDAGGQDAVRGITRLQKLLFVVQQRLAGHGAGFYAFNYGPFDEGVNDAADALRLAGFLRGTNAPAAGAPSFEEMIATAAERSGPREQAVLEHFQLNERGHDAAERIRQSSRAYDELYASIRKLRKEWDTSDLVERVYEAWPEYAERSLIGDEVAERRARRRSNDT
jgi:predicted DNA binding CopG/RHH family protein